MAMVSIPEMAARRVRAKRALRRAVTENGLTFTWMRVVKNILVLAGLTPVEAAAQVATIVGCAL